MFKKLLLLFFSLSITFFVACSEDKSTEPNPTNPEPEVPVEPPNPDPEVPVEPPVDTEVYHSLIGSGANPALLADWYPQWKAKYVATLQDDINAGITDANRANWFIANAPGAMRVRWNGSSNGCSSLNQNCTVSEGVGYGMLIALFQEDWELFHGIYLYAWGNVERDIGGSGGSYLLQWILDSFTEYIDKSAATDADLDIATALILAHYKLKTMNSELSNLYLQHAKNVVNSVWDRLVEGKCSQNYLVCAGSSAMWYKEPVTFNLSYFAPVAFRLFAMIDPSHDWNAVLNANYAYMKLAQSKSVGLPPDWSDASGAAVLAPNGSSKATYNTYGKESLRASWRIAWDYHWFGSEDAKEVLDNMANFVVGQIPNPQEIPKNTFVVTDGSMSTSTTNISYWGSYCLMGIASHPEWFNTCLTSFNAQGYSSTYSYYTHILQMMFAQLMNGLYSRPAF